MPAPRLLAAPPVRSPGARLAEPTPDRPVSFLGDDRFLFLNQERRVPPGEWGVAREDLLWDYTFHYFDGLLAPAPAVDAKRAWIREWLARVPVGAAPAWDAYPTSRRILNWVRWGLSEDGDLPEDALESLASQVRYLELTLEYHLLANHLLTNAMALYAAGCFFGGDEGDGWLARGRALLCRELGEQFLGDGGHFELSPVYHALLLEDLLDVVQVARATGVEPDADMESAAGRAVTWLAALRRPDGRLPLFNDAAYGQGPEPAPLLAYAAAVLGGPVAEPAPGLTALEPSGYFRYAEGRLFLLGDVGPPGPSYQPGHAHCDLLSFELCWNGTPVIVDTGTSTYQVGDRRRQERGTAAHNTVQIGNLEQSEIWAGFRMARRAEVRRLDVAPDRIEAGIKAFPRGWSRLERSWTFRGEAVEMVDRVLEAPSGEAATARLHLHPGVALSGDGVDWVANGLHIRFDGARAVRVVPYQYAPSFDRRIPARCLEIRLGSELRTRISP